MKRLLIISCSATKRPDARKMPAVERYDGPTYRSLRKGMRANPFLFGDMCCWIISAKYGIIPPYKHISDYDMKMTCERAMELRSEIQSTLKRYFKTYPYSQCSSIFINLGKTYMLTLEGFDWGDHCPVMATGAIGMKTSQMKKWLTCS